MGYCRRGMGTKRIYLHGWDNFSLDIMNNTGQTITIEGDFYFEVEYDTQT